MNDAQRQRFIIWARSFMPPGCLGQPVARVQHYTEVQKRILEVVVYLWEEYTLKAPDDRRDIIIWGLCSDDKYMAEKATYLLEDLPVSQWPQGSEVVIADLHNLMELHWTSYKSKNGTMHSVKSKDRLGELLEKARLKD